MTSKAAELSAEALGEQLTGIRRHLHRHPELSNEEYETTKYITSQLTQAGIKILDYGLATGVIAEIGSGKPGPVIALRADIDALPIQEETDAEYASLFPGKMHACGHDFHTAALLGAAYLLKQQEDQLPGTVRLLFQPAEEKAQGAQRVIASGALREVRAVIGLHNKPDLPVGTIGIAGGPLMAAADGFAVEVKGSGSHAAVPEAAIDPIVAAAHIVTALQSVVSRNVSPLHSAVVSVTQIHSGNSWNVIPEKAVLEGTVRNFDEAVRANVLKRFEQVAAGVAAALGATAKVRWIEGPPPVINDEALAALGVEAAEALGYQAVKAVPSPAGEDFAFYQRELPGLFVFVGTNGSREWHHPAFNLDEQALPVAARFLADIAVRSIAYHASGGGA
ncbi:MULTISPECIES: amidohydrolase [unclassified Paenibacillus]|uniref:amidohydrolase n=1 Tax=unclassified Paenibacillus TaxID=185978 RepID=UPI002404ECBB|nr:MULTISPECIES: amidohydrolase [unclassified Paenibacillus]MDF9843484.1 amidohydrolase [Paenibacillus sp. PastF-2]MDF9850072.1 amidohydrolase [Paenibacillus sp. PastM-2]MDF9857724.1 amidohydrolase [Paenibacillus sp. PastF-1]MDH6482991.1 amidohydrolase [Paenibacillus sp. PastH-2]MDH6509206.1 amidohydrolase [Paenibacillus sp. PastM-3]